MDISTRDNSHEKQIERLNARIEALEAERVDLLADPASDAAEINAADAKARAERARKLSQLFREREALLQRLDEHIDAVIDIARAETQLRRDIDAAGLLYGVDKADKEQIRGDLRTNSAILARLGEGGIGQRQRGVPKLATLASVHARIITAVQGA